MNIYTFTLMVGNITWVKSLSTLVRVDCNTQLWMTASSLMSHVSIISVAVKLWERDYPSLCVSVSDFKTTSNRCTPKFSLRCSPLSNIGLPSCNGRSNIEAGMRLGNGAMWSSLTIVDFLSITWIGDNACAVLPTMRH